jgi:predicted Rossmann fold nucleotide-binding protein DprA/Smf involved in DNA uptake
LIARMLRAATHSSATARFSRSAQDVIDDLRLSAPSSARESRARPDVSDPLQRRLVELLRHGERSLDDLLSECGEAPAPVLAALSMLELAGVIEVRPGQRYCVAAGRC